MAQSPKSFVRLASWLQLPDFLSNSVSARQRNDTDSISLLRGWVRSHIGNSVNLQDLFLAGPPWQGHQSDDYHQESAWFSGNSRQLPDVGEVFNLLEWYRTSPRRRSFPIIDFSLFNDTMDLAYETSMQPLRGRGSATACVWALLALLGILDLDCPRLAIDCQEMALQAERLLPQVLREENMDGLQTILMLVCYVLLGLMLFR